MTFVDAKIFPDRFPSGKKIGYKICDPQKIYDHSVAAKIFPDRFSSGKKLVVRFVTHKKFMTKIYAQNRFQYINQNNN